MYNFLITSSNCNQPWCCYQLLTETSHEHHCVSGHWQHSCLFNSWFWLSIKKAPVDSLHKGPLMPQTFPQHLTHWGWVTHLYVNKLTIIRSNNGFFAWPVPSRYLNHCCGILLIRTLGTNFSELIIMILGPSYGISWHVYILMLPDV